MKICIIAEGCYPYVVGGVSGWINNLICSFPRVRMNSDIPKQYLMLKDRPVLYYALKAFQDSDIDSIVLAAGENDLEMCRTQIVEKYGINKVMAIVAGGAQRYQWN